jgi:hypothetical protein
MKLKTNTFAHTATRVAPLSLGAVSLAAVAMAWMPQTMGAQTPPPANGVLDNFATGGGKVAATSGIQTVTKTGSGIFGGSRYIQLSVNTADPYQQPVQVQVRPSNSASDPSSLLWSIGYGATPRIDLEYGNPPSAPLNLNLTGYDRLRVNFGGLTGPLNFNIEAYDINGVGGICGLNLVASGGNGEANAFTVDFPFSLFAVATLGGGTIDWGNIEFFDIIFQGGSNLAITKFLAIPTTSTEPLSPNVCAAPAT